MRINEDFIDINSDEVIDLSNNDEINPRSSFDFSLYVGFDMGIESKTQEIRFKQIKRCFNKLLTFCEKYCSSYYTDKEIYVRGDAEVELFKHNSVKKIENEYRDYVAHYAYDDIAAYRIYFNQFTSLRNFFIFMSLAYVIFKKPEAHCHYFQLCNIENGDEKRIFVVFEAFQIQNPVIRTKSHLESLIRAIRKYKFLDKEYTDEEIERALKKFYDVFGVNYNFNKK